MRRTPTRTRRVAAVVLAFAAALGLSAAVAPTGAAAPSAPAGCRPEAGMGHNTAQQTVVATRERVCDGTQLKTIITRNGKKVAEGVGIAIYHCRGTETGTFAATGVSPRPLPCG